MWKQAVFVSKRPPEDKPQFPKVGKTGACIALSEITGPTPHCLPRAPNCSPGVVFESASGTGLEWEPVQTEVAKFTEACWYDRAGMGSSDPRPFPRTAEVIARDVHELLRRAGVGPAIRTCWILVWRFAGPRVQNSLPGSELAWEVKPLRQCAVAPSGSVLYSQRRAGGLSLSVPFSRCGRLCLLTAS